jgi:hypothetical protein
MKIFSKNTLLILLVLFISACAPAATQAPTATLAPTEIPTETWTFDFDGGPDCSNIAGLAPKEDNTYHFVVLGDDSYINGTYDGTSTVTTERHINSAVSTVTDTVKDNTINRITVPMGIMQIGGKQIDLNIEIELFICNGKLLFPAASAIATVGPNVVVMVPPGRTNWHSFAIMPFENGGFNFYGRPFKETGINIPTSSGGLVKDRAQDIAIEVDSTVPQGTYYGQARLQDQNGVEQDFSIELHVGGPCDFIVPSQDGLPETFITMGTSDTYDMTIGTAKIHAICFDNYPVYTVSTPDKDCVVDTIHYGNDGTWGCYNGQAEWRSHAGGNWIAPYSFPQGWQQPEPDIDKMSPQTPMPQPGTVNG